jgi:hypothetical protein
LFCSVVVLIVNLPLSHRSHVKPERLSPNSPAIFSSSLFGSTTTSLA